MDKNVYIEKAREFHDKGYNCAQAVVCAFADRLGKDENELYKIAEGFGAGMGNRKGPCGALSGAVMVVGMAYSGGNDSQPTKQNTYRLARGVYEAFEEKCGAVNCEDIKGERTGGALVSCELCIKYAVEIAEKMLGA